MSQQKVDKYKQEKANRSQIMKKKKVTRRLEFIVVIAIVAAALVWFGVSVYNSQQQSEATTATYIDSEEVVSYMNDPANYSPEGESTEAEDESSEETVDEGDVEIIDEGDIEVIDEGDIEVVEEGGTDAAEEKTEETKAE